MANRKIFRGVKRNRTIANVISTTDADDSGNITTITDDGNRNTNNTQDDEPGIITVNPIDIEGTTSTDGEPRKRRGRKPGSKNKPRKETAQDLTELLLTIHMGLAAVSRTPELELDPEEAEKYSAAVQRVNDLYDGLVIPEKPMAWINLLVCTGTIYGTRAVAIYNRKQNEAKQRKLAKENAIQFPIQPGVN